MIIEDAGTDKRPEYNITHKSIKARVFTGQERQPIVTIHADKGSMSLEEIGDLAKVATKAHEIAKLISQGVCT